MSLARNITELAGAVAREIKSRITADHPGLARAWTCVRFCGPAGNEVLIRASFNVQSVTRMGQGLYRVTFERPMLDAYYCWAPSACASPQHSVLEPTVPVHFCGRAKTDKYFEVLCTNHVGKPLDPCEFNLMVWR